jgi:hypothetical protein
MEVTPRIVRARKPAGNAAGFRLGAGGWRATFAAWIRQTRSRPRLQRPRPKRTNVSGPCSPTFTSFAGFVVPFGNLGGPLLIWLLKKDTMPLVNDQGKEALNFQITMTLAIIVAALSIFVLIGFILVPALVLFDIIITIVAAVKANEGVAYRYPFCLRLVS